MIAYLKSCSSHRDSARAASADGDEVSLLEYLLLCSRTRLCFGTQHLFRELAFPVVARRFACTTTCTTTAHCTFHIHLKQLMRCVGAERNSDGQRWPLHASAMRRPHVCIFSHPPPWRSTPAYDPPFARTNARFLLRRRTICHRIQGFQRRLSFNPM